MNRQIVQIKVLPATDGVKCVKFECGHEVILSVADFRKFPSGPSTTCVECARQHAAKVLH